MTDFTSSQVRIDWRPGDYSGNAEPVVFQAADEIDLTDRNCQTMGAEPVRAGATWTCQMYPYHGTTALQLGNGTTKAGVSLVIWDPITLAHQATIAGTVSSARATDVAIVFPDTLEAGRYRCALVIAWPAGATWTHCEGDLVVLPEIPS